MTFKREAIPALIVLMGVLHLPVWLVSEAFRPDWIVLGAKLAMHVTLAVWVFLGSRTARVIALLDPIAVACVVVRLHDYVQEIPAHWMLSASLANAVALGLIAFGPPHAWQQIAGACIAALGLLPSLFVTPFALAMLPPDSEEQAVCARAIAKLRREGLEPLREPYEHVPAAARAYVDAEDDDELSEDETTVLLAETLNDSFGHCYAANRRLERVTNAVRAGEDSLLRNEPAVGAVAEGLSLCHCQTVDLPTLTFMVRLVTYP